MLWKSFEEFKKDMYDSYIIHIEKYGLKETTIDRINNEGNYCKKNCQWSTRSEQMKNRRYENIINRPRNNLGRFFK